MIPTILTSASAALSFGVSNFAGGRASRAELPVRVAAGSHLVGLAFILVVALVWGSTQIVRADLAWGAAAGLVSAGGVLSLYVAMRAGRMGVVMPITAGIASAVPVVYGVLVGERLTTAAWIGLGVIFAAVILVSIPGPTATHGPVSPRALAYAALAGLFFACSFIFLSNTDPTSGMWPTVSLRLVSAGVLVVGAFAGTRKVLPCRKIAGDVIIAGTLETLATVFVLLSVQRGPVAVAAIVVGLYPGITAVLARILLDERLAWHQIVGIVLALSGIALLAI